MSLHAMTALRVHRSNGGPPLSLSDAYAIASIELYSRLWLALERLVAGGNDLPQIETALVVVRLELVVLLDACDSPSWRSMLRAEQILQLRSNLKSVLRLLSQRVDDGLGLLADAQDRLLDAVLTQCSCTPHPVRSTPSSWQSNPEPELRLA